MLRLLAIGLLSVNGSILWAEGVALPDGTTLRQIDFERHVAPLFQKFGCSTGSCHGSFQGRGGFRLSLFGDDSMRDYHALTREALSRRIDRENPANSLLIRKITGQIPHEGGKRFESDSWSAKLIEQWIESGASYQARTGSLQQIRFDQPEYFFAKAEAAMPIRLVARFEDGTEEEVTSLAEITIRDRAIAQLRDTHHLIADRSGDTILIARYRGHLATASILVSRPRMHHPSIAPFAYHNWIDREIGRRLERLNIEASPLSSDSEFIRRVYIDTIGQLPTPEETIAFLNDRKPNKREQLIELLLNHPLHSAIWATRWCDIMGNSTDQMDGTTLQRTRQSKMWFDWLRKRFQENQPWDAISRQILTATSRQGQDIDEWIAEEANLSDTNLTRVPGLYANRSGLDLFWRRSSNEEFISIEQLAEITSTVFLGVRIDCAQCHKHPFDRWSQIDYRGFANLFSQLKYGRSNEQVAAIAKRLQQRRMEGKGDTPFPRLKELYIDRANLRLLSHPETKEPLAAKILGGPEVPLTADTRESLANWLTDRHNPYFAKAFVNRVWAHYFGRGIVDPVDQFSLANPPSHPQLLDALARDFIENGYNLRRLERLILNSRTYQLSSIPNESNRWDETNYSHRKPRKLLAEVSIDLIHDLLEIPRDFGPLFPNSLRCTEIGTNRLSIGTTSEWFRTFHKPNRQTICDCERSPDVNLSQTLFLMTQENLFAERVSPRWQKFIEAQATNDQILDEIFLRTVCRYPTDRDRELFLEPFRIHANREAAIQEILWAIVNSREFILNH